MLPMYRSVTLTGEGRTYTFSNRELKDGFEHWLTDLKGWTGGVSVKGDNEDRALGHGQFAEPSKRTHRTLTLVVTLRFATELDRDLAEREISGFLGEGGLATMEVTFGAQTLTAVVKLDGEIQTDPRPGIPKLNVQIPLRAPDPFLYGEQRTLQMFPSGVGEGLVYSLFASGANLNYGNSVPTSTVLVTNGGNAPAWPVFVVRGDFPSGFRIVNGTRTVEWSGAVFAQSPVTVDMARGAVTVRGADQSHMLNKRDWWSIPPNGAAQPRFTGIQPGTGWCDILVRDTYI